MSQPRREVRNIAVSLAGQLVPALAAVITIPLLLKSLGADRLGVLSLAWMALGALSLLDLGLGRALSIEVAGLRGAGRPQEVLQAVRATVALLVTFGVMAALGLLGFQDSILAVLQTPPALVPEVRHGLVWIALAAPFVTAASAVRSVLEAYGRFDLANAIRVPTGVLTYLAPALALPLSGSVAVSVALVAAVRIVSAAAMSLACAPLLGARPWGATSWRHLKAAVGAGWWINVATLAGIVLSFADRFVVGSLMSLAAVAHYSSPQEVVSRFTVVPAAIGSVLLPAMSAARATASRDMGLLYRRSLAYTFLGVLPPAAATAALAPEWLAWWLGEDFARASAQPAQWLALAVLLQSLSMTPLNLLQATGHASATAWLQLLQLPLLIVGLHLGVSYWGVTGAAVALAGRMLFDLSALVGVAWVRIPETGAVARRWLPVVVAALAWFSVVPTIATAPARLSFLALAGVACLASAAWVLAPEDVAYWRQRLRQMRNSHG